MFFKLASLAFQGELSPYLLLLLRAPQPRCIQNQPLANLQRLVSMCAEVFQKELDVIIKL